MDENARLREIFRQINEMLMDYAQEPLTELSLVQKERMDAKTKRIGREAERLQNVIAAYFEQQTAMMQNLMKEERFWRFPLPRKRIPIWMRIRLRIELRKATWIWISDKRQDS